MLRRFWMVIRSFFGFLLRRTEDPEMLLRQYIDDMRAKVPKLRAAVAEVLATEYQLQQQAEHLQKQIDEYDKQIIAALKLGYEEEAKVLIAAKAQAEESLQDTLEQLETARRASQQARAALEDYQREMERKIAEARRLIGQAQLAKLQEELAQAMAAFEVGTPTDVLERMREKVQERLARAQARAEVAATDINSRMREIKRATASIGVEERLLEYKRQLGMLPEPKETEKTMLPQPEQQGEQTRPL
ncbi:MAG: PspA/IM30 family protein [Armatimonadetes bacterium]|nr:PspA/IM30 family protein [Armatimonadota bacterium]MCX7968268.1 PspA/IM30 family protein [Armatimonadota bacterium]MDW8142089.1 PspA/IM30 family protein [Armatimonadota bacterium]